MRNSNARILLDDWLYEELLAGEDELIDEFLTNDLSEDEVVMFHQNFLVGTERQRKLQTGKALKRYAASTAEWPGQKLS